MTKLGPATSRINWDEFDKLVSYQCTQKEIAHFFGISVDTLERACLSHFGQTLADLWDKRKAFGKVRLRKAEFDIVERGGPGAATMAIYLDKKMFPDERPDLYQPKPPDPEPQPQGLVEPTAKKTFAQFCLTAGYFEPFPKQIEMADFGFNETVIRLLLGARGYGKTDFVTIMRTAYWIYCAVFDGLDPADYTVLIITKSKARNAAITQEIGDALEKNGVQLSKKNSSVIRVEGLIGQDHSVEAITIKSSMRGRHPKLVIMDDPVTDEDVSEAMRTLVKRRYDEVVKLCKNVLIIGQPAHAHDLYAQLRGIVKTMEMPHGLIPELDADLTAMKIAGVDPNSIEMSYHLRIPVSGTAPFSKIKFIDEMPFGDCVAFIDPSDGGDYTATSIIKGFFDGVAVEGHEWKMAWYHCLDEMAKVFKARGVKQICFETNMTGTHPLIQLRQVFGPMGIGVVGKASDSNKHACIMQAGSYAPMIHLSKTSGRTYTDHVVQYEYGAKFDDAPDSLARGLEWLGLIRGKR